MSAAPIIRPMQPFFWLCLWPHLLLLLSGELPGWACSLVALFVFLRLTVDLVISPLPCWLCSDAVGLHHSW